MTEERKVIGTLVRRHLLAYPDWEMIKPTVPLGKKYEVVGFHAGGHIRDLETGRTIHGVDCYIVIDEEGNKGYMATDFLLVD